MEAPSARSTGPTDANLAAWQAANMHLEEAGNTAVPRSVPNRLQPATRRPRRHWTVLTRAWTVTKMTVLIVSTLWSMSALHTHLGANLAALGAVCAFSGVGARWRRRYFGPGQLLEPELYELVGYWLYRVGAVLILVGGTLAAVAPRL